MSKDEKRFRPEFGQWANWLRKYFPEFRKALKENGEEWFVSRFIDDKNKSFQYSDSGAIFTGVSFRKLANEDEVAEFFDIDRSRWRIKKWICQAMTMNMKLKSVKKIDDKYFSVHDPHEATNWNVRVELEPIEMQVKLFDKLAERYKDFEPPKLTVKQKKEVNKCCALVNIYDAHLDKITLKSEAGENSTLESNVARFKDAIIEICDYLVFLKPEKIFYPVGNDLYHSNGMNGLTKRGQDLQFLVSPEESYEVISELAIWSIYQLAQIAEVRIPMIHGNHDKDKITILGFWLEQMFKNDSRISINKTRRQRKYEQYGRNMFGFAHGDKERKQMHRMPVFMAQEAPDIWAATKYRRFYLGDLHHTREYQFLKTIDQVGVTVEHLRSITAADRWHDECGWVGIPKTAYVHDFSIDGRRSNRHEINFI